MAYEDSVFYLNFHLLTQTEENRNTELRRGEYETYMSLLLMWERQCKRKKPQKGTKNACKIKRKKGKLDISLRYWASLNLLSFQMMQHNIYVYDIRILYSGDQLECIHGCRHWHLPINIKMSSACMCVCVVSEKEQQWEKNNTKYGMKLPIKSSRKLNHEKCIMISFVYSCHFFSSSFFLLSSKVKVKLGESRLQRYVKSLHSEVLYSFIVFFFHEKIPSFLRFVCVSLIVLSDIWKPWASAFTDYYSYMIEKKIGPNSVWLLNSISFISTHI